MTDLEYYRMHRLVPQLRRLAKEYPMRTLDNVIVQIDARLNHHKSKKGTNR